MVGDFDTGSSHTFVDYEFLSAQNLVRPELRDYLETHIKIKLYRKSVRRVSTAENGIQLRKCEDR